MNRAALPEQVDVAVVGGGIAGLIAARELAATGRRVTVLDKGRRPGGRCATRRVDGAVFDHGAQFLTARDPWFASLVGELRDAGAVRPWFTGLPDLIPHDPEDADADHEVRYRGHPTMRTIAEQLASDVDLHLATRVTRVAPDPAGWTIDTEDVDHGSAAGRLTAGALLMTPPVPQTTALLDAGEVALDPLTRATLDTLTYEPCIAVLAIPDGPTRLLARGAVRLDREPLAFITDHRRSGASPEPAVTVHASAEASHALWDAGDARVFDHLLSAASRYLGVDVTGVHVHRWRYAAPRRAADVPALIDTTGAPLAFAGDAFVGGRIEGAALSGRAAAQLLSRRTSTAR